MMLVLVLVLVPRERSIAATADAITTVGVG